MPALRNLENYVHSCATWPILRVDKCQRKAREFYRTTATYLWYVDTCFPIRNKRINYVARDKVQRGQFWVEKVRFTRDAIYERAFIGNDIN